MLKAMITVRAETPGEITNRGSSYLRANIRGNTGIRSCCCRCGRDIGLSLLCQRHVSGAQTTDESTYGAELVLTPPMDAKE